MKDYLIYPKIVEGALRGVVRQALEQVAEHGLRGNHHVYVSFRTKYPGVVLSDYLREKYPDEMTIVLQHRFWDLRITDTVFEVGLSFNNVPEAMTIPFAAMTGFADPSVQFGLQFQGGTESANAAGPESGIAAAAAEQAELGTQQDDIAKPGQGATAKTDATDGDGPAREKVVTLDSFRKK